MTRRDSASDDGQRRARQERRRPTEHSRPGLKTLEGKASRAGDERKRGLQATLERGAGRATQPSCVFERGPYFASSSFNMPNTGCQMTSRAIEAMSFSSGSPPSHTGRSWQSPKNAPRSEDV